MNRILCAVFLCVATPLVNGCEDDDGPVASDDSGDTGELPPPVCNCAEGQLTAVDGCENFGGDQEECSGWDSCLTENGRTPGDSFPSGTEFTCFGCTIRLECVGSNARMAPQLPAKPHVPVDRLKVCAP